MLLAGVKTHPIEKPHGGTTDSRTTTETRDFSGQADWQMLGELCHWSLLNWLLTLIWLTLKKENCTLKKNKLKLVNISN